MQASAALQPEAVGPYRLHFLPILFLLAKGFSNNENMGFSHLAAWIQTCQSSAIVSIAVVQQSLKIFQRDRGSDLTKEKRRKYPTGP